jgi:hypothetical protein
MITVAMIKKEDGFIVLLLCLATAHASNRREHCARPEIGEFD